MEARARQLDPEAPPSAVRSLERQEPPRPLEPLRGVVDGRYTLERFLAGGGAAEVFAARHRYTGRAVALKLPLRGTPPDVHDRLRQEIELLARIHHPGVVQLLDAGEVPEGPYLVLELLEGRTLEAVIASRGTMGEGEVIRLGVALADALCACHAQGILHRDVKPANVILQQAGAKLIDFNVARDADDRERRRLTQVGQIVGTPEYMPIEAMLGLASADHRVDVFGLGMTLYECLIGSVPHAYTARSVSVADILARRPDLSPALASAVASSLARDPAERTPTMAALLEALRAAEARPQPSEAAAAGSDLRRHPRAPFRTPLRLVDAKGERSDGRMEEISASGAQLVAPSPAAQGSLVHLRFALPTGAITEVDGLVRWARQGNRVAVMGVEFVNLGAEARALIELYVYGTTRRGK